MAHRKRSGTGTNGACRPISKEERLAARAALALRLWASRAPTIALSELSAEVSATFTGLSERGYTEDQAGHSIGSGSLLVRTGRGLRLRPSVGDGVAGREAAVADTSGHGRAGSILATRRMSRLMVGFFADLAGHEARTRLGGRGARRPKASQAAKQNALAVINRPGQEATHPGAAGAAEPRGGRICAARIWPAVTCEARTSARRTCAACV